MLQDISRYYKYLLSHGVQQSLKLAKNKINRKLGLPSHLKGFPENILIEISTICNLNCEYCTLRTSEIDKQIMLP